MGTLSAHIPLDVRGSSESSSSMGVSPDCAFEHGVGEFNPLAQSRKLGTLYLYESP